MPLLARSRGFTLIGESLLHGLTPEAAAAWSQVPGAAELVGGLSAEEAAEAHTRALTLELAPYESAFLSGDGLVGGDVAAAVAELRGASGYPAATDAPDHVGEELRWMGFLTGAAADAARDDVPGRNIADLEREVLDRHLLRWLPAFVASLRAQAEAPPIFVLIANLALALAVHRRQAIGGPAREWALPPVAALLDEERTGLRRIAEHLALPAQAGGCLCRSTLVSIGRRLELPAGFGTRADLLEGLLRSAAHYDRVPQLVGALGDQLTGWDAAWSTLTEGGLAPLATPWHRRIAHTRSLLDRLASAR